MSKFSADYLSAYWMPYTGNREFKKNPRMIASAKGSYLFDTDGRKVFDGLSGLWTCGAGHGRPEITEAVAKQMATLDFGPSFQYGHPLAFELATRLKEMAPGDLNHVFYTNSGSESADTATKIARGYWRQSGQPTKTIIIGREKGYHGASWGGISFGGIGANRKLWGVGIDSDHLPHTQGKDQPFLAGMPARGAEMAEELESLVALHDASNIAAVIIEPLAGSAGVIPPPEGYLKRLREICDKHDILLIFDEVITAFGRMGSMFGAQEFGVTPDILNTAKQLTNGAVPMGAVLVTSAIYDAFMDAGGPEYSVELPHGYTYSGHPVACAAAMASLDILENDGLVDRVRDMSPVFAEIVHGLKGTQYISDIRSYGFAAGLTIESYPGEPARRPFEIAMKCWEKGFYVRYGGDTIQLGLPFLTEREEMDAVCNALAESINALN
ncbi:MAG: aspartate aminotransferase family protein [Porticoccus sp.]